MPCLPEPTDAGATLGTLLTAQAAIAALTLAVTLFMMQGIRTQRDVDDRAYREYVRRSWIRDILWGSLLAVGVTATFLVIEGFVSADGATTAINLEFRNFVLAAGLAFLLNLVLTVILFERAIHHSRPQQWMALRRDVNKVDVRKAVQAFLRRARRALDAHEAEEPDFSVLFPDQGEGSADEAVRSLLDDARRAMSDRRHDEVRQSLNSVRELVKYAMDEIRETGIQWSAPGAQPEWPPLRELSRNLNSFREDVIREGDREYIFELLSFDYWLAVEGVRERCGELFTVGLNGYRWNYQIATRIGSEFREVLRDRFALNADGLILGSEPAEMFPYAREMVRQQEWLLSDAMHSHQPSDYGHLHKGFHARLQAIRLHWGVNDWPPSEASELYQQLEQEYRIALMGLGGRALLLAQADRLADVDPYLDVERQVYYDLRPLADDLAPALLYGDRSGYSLWTEWETEGALPYQTMGISPDRYPLLFFTLRLMELSSDTVPALDLHGRAERALDWFSNNWELVGSHVQAHLDLTLDQCRDYAIEALQSAVRNDGVAEDYEIIGRELSTTRVSALKSEVYAAAFSGNSVERLFKRAGVSLYLPKDAADAPEERVIAQLIPKAYLTDTPEGALTDYAPLRGDQWGRALSHDVHRRFCEALEGAPEMLAPLDTPVALLEGIDLAMEDLDGSAHAFVMLAGNWSDLQVGLGTRSPEGYEAAWRIPEAERVEEVGRYRGHPMLNARDYEGRCLYVVEPTAWGHFVRAQVDSDEDVRVDINPISIARARELLESNPDHFADEPDEESKLRKLQTHVEIVVGARTGFRLTDPSRARRIVSIHQPEVNEASEA